MSGAYIVWSHDIEEEGILGQVLDAADDGIAFGGRILKGGIQDVQIFEGLVDFDAEGGKVSQRFVLDDRCIRRVIWDQDCTGNLKEALLGASEMRGEVGIKGVGERWSSGLGGMDKWMEGQKVVEGGEDSLADAASSLEAMSDCFWVRLPRASVAVARSKMSMEGGVLWRVMSLSMFFKRRAALAISWSVWAARVVVADAMVPEKADWEEVMALRSLRVLACWVKIASMNVLVGVRSGRMLERKGVSLAAMASEMVEALVSRMFSSMRNAAA